MENECGCWYSVTDKGVAEFECNMHRYAPTRIRQILNSSTTHVQRDGKLIRVIEGYTEKHLHEIYTLMRDIAEARKASTR